MSFVYEAFAALYTTIPRLKYVGYFAAKSKSPAGELFKPFNGPRYLLPGELDPNETAQQRRERQSNPTARSMRTIKEPLMKLCNAKTDATHALYTLSKSVILPKLSVRKARVEDCDDLVPMLKRHHVCHVYRKRLIL